MLTCESCQALIADGLYDQLAEHESRSLQQHLQDCDACKQVMHEMQTAKSALESRGISSDIYDDIPERAELDDLWERLQPNLDRIDAERYRQSLKRKQFFSSWGPAMAIAASVVLVFSVLFVNFNQPQAPTPEVATVQQPVYQVDPELLQYLNRAQTMLMQVANTDMHNASAAPLGQTYARNMAQEANFLNASKEDSFSSGQSRLIKDIEYLLLQIANLDESNMAEGVALLQRFMEENSILFRIRLEEMREQQQTVI